MENKKTLLFVNESLACAGGEKSLLTLLSVLDYTKYEVYLQLFHYGCPWDALIDSHVHLLPPLAYSKFLGMSFKRQILYAFSHNKFRWLYARILYSLSLRLKSRRIPENACKFWKFTEACIGKYPQHFDVAIAYAQGLPTFYVADKVKADKKLAWVNASYRLSNGFRDFVLKRFDSMDHIIAVSETAQNVLLECFPTIKEKLTIFMDLISPAIIQRLSEESIQIKKEEKILTLLTMGRLFPYAKGYDIALEVCSILKDKLSGNFKWYILGIGPYEQVMREYISVHHLENNMILLGVKENPYPYLKLADIYVQTSRQEGFGLAIAEARLLDIPVVVTRYDSVDVQIVDGDNGIIAEIDAHSVADKILELYGNEKMYNHITNFQKNEKKGNLELLPKFYQLFEG